MDFYLDRSVCLFYSWTILRLTIGGDRMKKTSVIIAGSSGLVGSEVLKLLLNDDRTEHVYSVSRRLLECDQTDQTKLTQIISPDLHIQKEQFDITPSIGVIALGSTVKQAGSKEKLRDIDVHLVVETAQKMKSIGVSRVLILSCLGADEQSRSHYLRCKGEMERKVMLLGFHETIFIQPGPLAGERSETRIDEKLLQFLSKLVKPLMRGKLSNYVPIQASSVASALAELIHLDSLKSVERISSSYMMKMINRS